MSFHRKNVICVVMAFIAIGLSGNSHTAGLDVEGALGKVKGAVKAVKQSAEGMTVPSGATVMLRKVDQNLAKVDGLLSGERANYDKDFRSKEAAAKLLEAQEGMKTIGQRYGAKMGNDHPELVSRRERIAALEPKVKAFQGDMASAMKKEDEAQAAKEKRESEEETAREKKNADGMAQRQKEAENTKTAMDGSAGGGKIVFSKSPIDPANPTNLTSNFEAGDYIYGLILVDKSWREIYEAKGKTELGVMVGLTAGDEDDYQYITMKKAQYIDSKYLVLDIAPDPGKMTAYKDPDIEFGEGKGNRKIGPVAFTHDLAQLPAGKHTVKFYVRNYGEKPATGELEIEGTNFEFYASLNEKITAGNDAGATLPPAGMINKNLEGQMRALLENAGWTSILRIVIVDKDWWVEEGVSRYLNVAAAAKGSDGQCYWRNTKFSQPSLIDGSWGPLELTSTGVKRNITEGNIGK